MTQEHGSQTAVALRRYDAVAVLNKKSASEIIEILFPGCGKASPAEMERAIGLCVDYGADPRLGDLYMLPFKVKAKTDREGRVIEPEKTTYTCARGIKFSRKVALRKHHYSYVDMTPRYMTEAEEKAVFQTVNPDKIRFITKLKDMDTGAEGYGWGEWPKYRYWVDDKAIRHQEDNQPKGSDKGNSRENMAAIRSERNCLDRMYPTEMPDRRIPVVDERFIEGEFKVMSDEVTDELEDRGGQQPPPPPAPPIKTAGNVVHGGPAAASTGTFEELFGPDKTEATTGEVPMDDAELKKAIEDLRDMIKTIGSKLSKKVKPDGSKMWTTKELSQKIREVVGNPGLSNFEDIPDDKVSAVAHMMADLDLVP